MTAPVAFGKLMGPFGLRHERASPRMANLKRVLWHLLGGTRGGPLRIRVIRLLLDRPYNTNQVAQMLGIDYKTAQHHLRVLAENRIATPTGDSYGAVFILTKDFEESLPEFEAIAAKVAPGEASA